MEGIVRVLGRNRFGGEEMFGQYLGFLVDIEHAQRGKGLDSLSCLFRISLLGFLIDQSGYVA